MANFDDIWILFYIWVYLYLLLFIWVKNEASTENFQLAP